MFAKLFEPAPGKQILVKIDEGEDGPEVRIYCECDGLGVCSLALSYLADDKGWDDATKAFEKIDQGVAEELARKVADTAAEIVGG